MQVGQQIACNFVCFDEPAKDCTCLWTDVKGKEVAISQGTQQVWNPLKLCKQQAPRDDLQQYT